MQHTAGRGHFERQSLLDGRPEGLSCSGIRFVGYIPTFIASARRKLPGIALPALIWRTRWVVYCKPCYHAADKTLTYLARYIHQTAIANSRILTAEQGKVTFRYKDSRECRWKTMTLEPSEFIRRFLQHVLPRGFHKVRHYGLLSPRNQRLREWVQWELTKNTEAAAVESPTLGDLTAARDQPAFLCCPLCHEGHLIPIMTIPRRWRAPP